MVSVAGPSAPPAVDQVLITIRNIQKGLDTTREVPRELIEDCLRVAIQALVLAGPTFPPTLRTVGPLTRAVPRSLRYESPGLLLVNSPYFVRGGPISLARFLRSAQHDRPEDLITSVRCPVTVVRDNTTHSVQGRGQVSWLLWRRTDNWSPYPARMPFPMAAAV